jgi:diacylglycerol kinase family enzyme
VLLVNPNAGGGEAMRVGLPELASEFGIEVVVLSAQQELAALAAEAVVRGADALGIAGGDGSLAVVAAAAQKHGLPFVCIPTGTRNHFARDLGVPRHDVVGALAAFTDAVERRIDVAEINGRAFLNNVSLGIYGDAVGRATYRGAKVRTLLETAFEVLGPSADALELRLVDDLGREYHHPAVVLVSNNPYALHRPLARGIRPTLASGRLGVVVLDSQVHSSNPRGHAWHTSHLTVTAQTTVHAGVDGEAVTLRSPLEFVIRPAALRVRMSANRSR